MPKSEELPGIRVGRQNYGNLFTFTFVVSDARPGSQRFFTNPLLRKKLKRASLPVGTKIGYIRYLLFFGHNVVHAAESHDSVFRDGLVPNGVEKICLEELQKQVKGKIIVHPSPGEHIPRVSQLSEIGIPRPSQSRAESSELLASLGQAISISRKMGMGVELPFSRKSLAIARQRPRG